jgi:hypothetical protein
MTPSDFWQPFEFTVKSFDDLVKIIDQIMDRAVEHDIQFAWRGQVDASWALHSSLYRRLSLTSGATPDEAALAERELEILIDLHRWGLHTHPTVGRLSVLNQLAMLQHYGAPTRLIDITLNAWVGVWFAVERKWQNGSEVHHDKDARLFAVDVTGRLTNEHDDYRSWEDSVSRPWPDGKASKITKEEWTTSVYAWRPSRLDGRISAQSGAFLFGGVPATTKPDGNKFQFPKSPNNKAGNWRIEEGRSACSIPLRPHKFDATRGKATTGALYTFRIDASAKQPIRERLEKLFGYTHATIYPDYTGFATFGTPTLKSW